jgi:hypothetical protein
MSVSPHPMTTRDQFPLYFPPGFGIGVEIPHFVPTSFHVLTSLPSGNTGLDAKIRPDAMMKGASTGIAVENGLLTG